MFISGNNPAPKPMPNIRQQKQKEGNQAKGPGRRVPMPLMPPPRAQSLKIKHKTVGANFSFNKSTTVTNSNSNNYNNKSIVKRNNNVMMPLPKVAAVGGQKTANKSTAAVKSSADSGPLPQQLAILNGTRLMTGSIQMVAKWWHNNHSKQFKDPPPPPLFETVGELVDSDKAKRHDSEQRFDLRNLPQWRIEDYHGDVNSISRPKDDELLHCYHYAIDNLNMPPNGTIVRYCRKCVSFSFNSQKS
jgi:hypothetical protein